MRTWRSSAKASIPLLMACSLVALGPGISGATDEFCELEEEDRPPIQEPVELCATTVMSGDIAASIQVKLPRMATITPQVGEGAGIEVQGAGPFVGIALIQDPPSLEATGFIAARTPVAPGGYVFVGLGGLMDCSPCTLAPGEYRLYLLAGDGPTSVTLHLDGLTGSVELTPVREVEFEARRPTRQIDVGHNLLVATSGDTFEMKSPGFLYQGIRILDVEVTALGVFHCRTEPLPGYVPVCHDGNIIHGGPTWVGQRRDPSVTRYSLEPSGAYAQGAWFLSPVPPTQVESVGVWLSFG